MMTELMPIEQAYSTLALDPCELKAAALATAQNPDMRDEPGVPPVAEVVASALGSVFSANALAHAGAMGGEDEENEIQRYMERLLRRVGNPPSNPGPSPVQQVTPRVEPVPVVALLWRNPLPSCLQSNSRNAASQ